VPLGTTCEDSAESSQRPALTALMAEALDGSKKVIAEKNKQRAAVVKTLRLLGRYVEVKCKDMAIFKLSYVLQNITRRCSYRPCSWPRHNEQRRKATPAASSFGGWREIFLRTQPHLLAVMQGGEYRLIGIGSQLQGLFSRYTKPRAYALG